MKEFNLLTRGQSLFIINPPPVLNQELLCGKILYDSMHGLRELKDSEVVGFEREMEASLNGAYSGNVDSTHSG